MTRMHRLIRFSLSMSTIKWNQTQGNIFGRISRERGHNWSWLRAVFGKLIARIRISGSWKVKVKYHYFSVGQFGWKIWSTGSFAGEAHVLKDNTSILRCPQREQKSCVEQKGKSSFISYFHYEYKLWKCVLTFFRPSEFKARGFKIVTSGITCLWQPMIHSEVVFWSFNVGYSY